MELHTIEPALIERLALNTWPAETAISLGNWTLRASGGITRRANSVLAAGPYPEATPDWLDNIEQFYRERGLPCIVQLSGASPDDLDKRLQAAGYIQETSCHMLVADSQEALRRSWEAWQRKSLGQTIDIRWQETADEQWIAHFLQLEGFGNERKPFYEKLFARMPAGTAFVHLTQDGEPVALGTAVVEQDWAGFLNVVVRESCRGQGLGYLLMNALTAWSVERGAQRQYLQVLAANEPALGLYANIGYRAFYGYHYRIKYDL